MKHNNLELASEVLALETLVILLQTRLFGRPDKTTDNELDLEIPEKIKVSTKLINIQHDLYSVAKIFQNKTK